MIEAIGWFRRWRATTARLIRVRAEVDALRAELELVAQERDSLRDRLRRVEIHGHRVEVSGG